MAPYYTLDDLDVAGKHVLVRVDINSPVEDGKLAGLHRLEGACRTLGTLASRDARVVVLAHQGRKGDPDFTSLALHADALTTLLDQDVGFVPDVAGPGALDAIAALEPGEILVLENVRGLDEENQQGEAEAMARVPYVQRLAGAVDLYANDAFSAAHRAQPSLVGFPMLLPSAAGLLMDAELTALGRAVGDPVHPNVYLLGGAKVDDAMEVMDLHLRRGSLDRALLGGLVGELFLVARGVDLGERKMAFLRERGILQHVDAARELLARHGDAITTPVDVGVRTEKGRVDVPVDHLPVDGTILDVGPRTVAAYRDVLGSAASVFLNGPVGLYEEPPYDRSTRDLLEAVRDAPAFSVLGGGHTVSALRRFGFATSDFGYVSLAGGALMAYLTGRPLPAVEALEASRERFPDPDP